MNMVKVEATKTAVTTVKGDKMRFNVVTNEDAKAAKAAEDAGEANTHTFFTTRSIADQLVAKQVVKIVGEADEEGEGSTEATPASEAKKRLADNAEADQAGERTSGADTRDTTAFAKKPATRGETNQAAPSEGSTADAPPVDDDAADAKPKKKAGAAAK